MDPELARAHYERGLAHRELSQLDLAVSDFRKVLKIQPDHVPALGLLSQTLSTLGQHEAALTLLNHACQAGDLHHDPSLLRLRAACHEALGNIIEADADLAAADAEEDHKLCVICMEVEREGRLLPCLHAALCRDCANELYVRKKPCPICGTRIASVELGVFMSTFALEAADLSPLHEAPQLDTPSRMRSRDTANNGEGTVRRLWNGTDPIAEEDAAGPAGMQWVPRDGETERGGTENQRVAGGTGNDGESEVGGSAHANHAADDDEEVVVLSPGRVDRENVRLPVPQGEPRTSEGGTPDHDADEPVPTLSVGDEVSATAVTVGAV